MLNEDIVVPEYDRQVLKERYLANAKKEQELIYQNVLNRFQKADKSRETLAKQADPMGLQDKRKKDLANIVGNVTPEHYKKLKKAGLKIETTEIKGDKGRKTGHKRKRILSPLDVMLKRGSISQAEHDAGQTFKKHWYWSKMMPSLVPKYEPRVDTEVEDLSAGERKVYYRRRFINAQLAVDEKFHPALGWLIQLLVDPQPIHVLGEFYAPEQGQRSQETVGRFALRMALWDLCQHYGFEHQMSRCALLDALKNYVGCAEKDF